MAGRIEQPNENKKEKISQIINAANFLLEAITPGSHLEVRKEIPQEIVVPGQKPKYRSIYISVSEKCLFADIQP